MSNVSSVRIVVTGGRHFGHTPSERAFIFAALDALHRKRHIARLAEGGARGVDRVCREWAELSHVEHICYPADWDLHRRAAGAIRNRLMYDTEMSDLLVAFPGGSGTADMVSYARRRECKVWMVADTIVRRPEQSL
jgi:hypothetical protein